MSLEQVSEVIKMTGLVAGGLWAAWTFHKLQRVRAAELENNEKITRIQKAHMEQNEARTRLLRQQPQLTIQLNISETAPLAKSGKTFLCVTVTLKNEGEQNLEVDFAPSTLTIGRIVPGADDTQLKDIHRFGPSYIAEDSDEPQLFSSRIFRIGQTRQMALAVMPVSEPGGYLVQFSAVYGKVPFDGEPTSAKAPLLINAIEQTIFFATGEG